MKKLLFGFAVCGLLAITALSANAKAPQFVGQFVDHQTPAPAVLPTPLSGAVVTQGVPMELYSCVKYKHTDDIHPCAVTKIVRVRDPRPVCQDPCSCCPPAPRYVYVKICVPPCGCVKRKVSHHGMKVKYDYGKYDVEIKSKNGVVYVEYDK